MALEPFPDRLRRLVRERGTSMERIAHDAWNPEIKGTSPNLLKKVLRGERRANVQLYEAVAGALGVAPDEFPEYRLALARRLFDEEELGLEASLENLSLLDAALGRAAAEVVARAAAPALPPSERSPKALPADRRRSPRES